MKVRLKDVKSNPWRYVNKGYPIDQAKVEKLRSSIKRTGFWDNLVAREHKGEIQIAYGHHRLEALRREYGLEHEVEMIMRDIDDAQMLKIMAAENEAMDVMSPMVINETIRAAKDFLESHPEEMKKLGHSVVTRKDEKVRIGDYVAKFLAWPIRRVEESLAALRSFEKGELRKEEYESIPFQSSADEFRKAVIKHRLPEEVRKRIVKGLVEQKMGGRWVEQEVMKYRLIKPSLQKIRDKKEITINAVAEGVVQGLLLASTNMTEKFLENWHYVSKENRGRILFAAKSVVSKIQSLQNKNKKLLGGKHE